MLELKERQRGFVLTLLTQLLDQLMCPYQLDQPKDTGLYQVHTHTDSLIDSFTHSHTHLVLWHCLGQDISPPPTAVRFSSASQQQCFDMDYNTDTVYEGTEGGNLTAMPRDGLRPGNPIAATLIIMDANGRRERRGREEKEIGEREGNREFKYIKD